MENNSQQPPQSPHNRPQGVMDVRPATPQPPTSSPQPNTAPPSPEETKPEPPKSHKSRAPKIVIAVAVIIALGLAAAATVAYLQSREETEPLQESDASQQETVQPATTDDVDETTKSVDEALNETDTAQEFPEEDLSDQTLGL